MNTIIRYGFIVGASYIGINWLADNPQTVNTVRNQVNTLVNNIL